MYLPTSIVSQERMYSSIIVMLFCLCCVVLLLLNESVSTNIRNFFWPKPRSKLNVISDSHHVPHFYQQLGNEEPPSDQDPAFADANVRKRICRDITGSRYFYWKGLDPIDMDEKIYQELRSSEYPTDTAIFHRMYGPPKNWYEKLRYDYAYTNEYTLEEFHIKSDYSGDFRIREHVFVCLLRRCISETVVPVYVSKEYNVFVGREPYMAGRFLLGVRGFHRHEIQLAESPAHVITNQNTTSLELHYLRTRRHRQPAASSDLDPICALVTTDLRNNQYHRLCAQVLRSDYFKESVEYPREFRSFDCDEREVAFRSKKAIKKADKRSYREFVVRCNSTLKDSLQKISVYVSRAYKKNEVFVYSVDDDDDSQVLEDDSSSKIYLINLSRDIGVVVE